MAKSKKTTTRTTQKKKSPEPPDTAAAGGVALVSKAPPLPPAIVPPIVAGAAQSYASITIKPPVYDEQKAKSLAAALAPRLDALDHNRLTIPRLDARSAALAALNVHALVTQAPALRARFERQASIGEFNLGNLADLEAVAFVVLYAYAQAEAAGAFATREKVPAKLVKEGVGVEKRMQALCEYKFKKDPEIAPLLALLAPGTGHADLAADLLGYVGIYEKRPKDVASDTTNYRKTDVADARRISGEILGWLAQSMSPRARSAYDLLTRAWTLLLQVYFEVQTVGRTLLRHDPRREELFPSLYAAGRSGRPKKAKAGKKGDGEGGETDA